jgi:hypothetical protein
MYRNQITLMMLAATVALLPSSAGATEYRSLCMSAPKHCTHTGPDAPVLRADVCLATSGEITLKGVDSCPSGSWPYYVDYGEVIDPIKGWVQAYIPLDDACGFPGMCDKAPPPDGSQEFPMCCYVNQDGVQVCVEDLDCGGTLWFCYDGVCNDDGTITCFQGNQQG